MVACTLIVPAPINHTNIKKLSKTIIVQIDSFVKTIGKARAL